MCVHMFVHANVCLQIDRNASEVATDVRTHAHTHAHTHTHTHTSDVRPTRGIVPASVMLREVGFNPVCASDNTAN